MCTGMSSSKLAYLQLLQVLLYLNAVSSINLTDGDVLKMPLTGYDVGRQFGEAEGDIFLVMPVSIVQFSVGNIDPSVHFIVFQAHSHLHNVSLSYSKELVQHRYVNGTNLGLVEMTKSVSGSSVDFFLHNANDFNVSIFVAAQAYGKNVPIPGGCNMEFSVEVAPFLRVSYDSSIVTVDSQRAAVAGDQYCETHLADQKVYHAYVTERDFSSETYFAALRSMMSDTNISRHAQEIPATGLISPLRRMYSAYSGTGSVHAVVATRGDFVSVYVPAFTYACDPTTDSCDVLKTPFSKVLCAVVLFVGLLMCLFGHKFFKTEMFLLGCISGGLVAHILISIFFDLNYPVNVTVSLVIGAFMGVIWLYVWCFCGSPVLSVLLATLTLGFIFTATMFYAGIADYNFVQSDLNFWALFSGLMLIVSLLLIPSNMKANIVSCAVLGAYAFIIPVDHYIGSNLKYITVNMIRRATVPDFKKAFINPPFQFKDLILTFTWIGLALAGVMIQCCQQRSRPPFPPPPRRNRWRGRRKQQQQRRPRRSRVTARLPGPRAAETSPLLAGLDFPSWYSGPGMPESPESPESPGSPESRDQLSKLRSYLSGLSPTFSPRFAESPTAPYISPYNSV
ncbi:transmembrane 7 superfamily member 3-like isoform X1 [Bacillus rossius redtenbacheri]|uniref:transmembrane 7 superfamily member 3-like isoform X1 n=1 Tax=Bacillus rossius redtenbacheri TaxID=93214 RepID=UPI002FDD1260